MSGEMRTAVWERSRRRGPELLMLLAISEHAGPDGRAQLPIATLAKQCRMGARNVTLLLSALKASGELEVQVGGGKEGNTYRITLATAQPPSPLKKPSSPEDLFTPEECFRGVPAGSESSAHAAAAPAAKPAHRTPTKRKPGTGKTVAVWDAYSEAFRQRHGIEPVSNAKVRGQLARVVDAVGVEQAPRLARFYLASTDRFYAERCHPVDLLLRDAQKLLVQMATGAGADRTWSRHSGFAQKDYREGIGPNGEIL